MSRVASLEIHKEELTFSAGHFTIFSATEREHLHGHNYYVSVAFKTRIEHNGLAFDYRYYRNQLKELCQQLDHHFMLPGNSPYLEIEDAGDYHIAHFNQKKIPFLKEDAVILPITNCSIEELSNWFLAKLLENQQQISAHGILGIVLKVYNGPGTSGAASWGETP